jgi:hypothetical protein
MMLIERYWHCYRLAEGQLSPAQGYGVPRPGGEREARHIAGHQNIGWSLALT